MTQISTERELASIAGSIVGRARLTAAERRLVPTERADPAAVAAYRDMIAAGQDPLGDCFLSLRPPETRRDVGAVYTPGAIVASMIRWAALRGTPARVVDPGAGSGRFLAAAARAFPDARLVACDIDVLAMLLLRANATVLGFADRLEARVTDYRKLKLPKIEEQTLYVGNPPYVRHHKISDEAKIWFRATAARLGFSASTLAGLHVHFFLRTREIAAPGDYGAFVTSAEWMDVNYGSVLRQMLADGLGGSSLQVFHPAGMPFADAMTTGAITTFLVGKRPDEFTVREVASIEDLDDLDAGRRVSWDEVRGQNRWSQMVRPTAARAEGLVELGELFRVHRGTVTGGNGVFLEGAYTGVIPDQFLVPTVTKAKDLMSAGAKLTAAYARTLRRVISLPANLSGLTAVEKRQVEAFKTWAKKHDGDKSWTAKARAAWWAVKLRDPAAILCTYMARRPPTFVRNVAGVPHINIAHGLYPRVPMTAADLDAYTAYLSSNVCTTEGRTYAGGLTKFEPKEIERLLVPCLERIHARPDQMDPPATASRRRGRKGDLPARAHGRDARRV